MNSTVNQYFFFTTGNSEGNRCRVGATYASGKWDLPYACDCGHGTVCTETPTGDKWVSHTLSMLRQYLCYSWVDWPVSLPSPTGWANRDPDTTWQGRLPVGYQGEKLKCNAEVETNCVYTCQMQPYYIYILSDLFNGWFQHEQQLQGKHLVVFFSKWCGLFTIREIQFPWLHNDFYWHFFCRCMMPSPWGMLITVQNAPMSRWGNANVNIIVPTLK